MSVDDQTSAGDRQRRWLCRALIVVGGTVAGISAACLFGSAQAAASGTDSVEDRGALIRLDRSSAPENDEHPDSGERRLDRADGPLRNLSRTLTGQDGAEGRSAPKEPSAPDSRRPRSEATADSAREPRGEDRHDRDSERELSLEPVLDPVSEGVETVRRGAEPVLRPVGHVTGTVLSGATGEESVTGVVESGLGRVSDSLGTGAAENVPPDAEQHTEHPPADGLGRTPSPAENTAAGPRPDGAELSEREPNLTKRSFTARTTVQDRTTDDAGKRGGQHRNAHRPGDLPPFPSGGCGCGTDASTPGGGGSPGFGLTGWTPALPTDTQEFDSPRISGVKAPVESDGPQPGTTPD
ncbi:hypothetical protein FHR84_004208 [Actinopolyspora biskrensis]|uniref:Uncharacterized protein n=1 Tax=Actinopolyspora biskrensis TaxID=1470178 RepID=A0A852Z3V1_9ACTN|nr:hypothetical protein [Actinopolyspora biskrensis]NYH80840.1 hypothetical protein [Actinopolyspora biskrensis]